MTIFVMHIRRQHCQGCGSDEQLSTLYQAEEVPRPGKAQKLLPCHSIGPMDPVHRQMLPIVMTPICSACVNDDAARIGYDVRVRWQETLQRKYAPAAPSGAARSGTKPTTPPSLEDLA